MIQGDIHRVVSSANPLPHHSCLSRLHAAHPCCCLFELTLTLLDSYSRPSLPTGCASKVVGTVNVWAEGPGSARTLHFSLGLGPAAVEDVQVRAEGVFFRGGGRAEWLGQSGFTKA